MATTGSLWLAAAALPLGFGVGAFVFAKPSRPPSGGVQSDPVARGRYLVEISGCGDCHTPHDQTGRPIAGSELTGHPPNTPVATWEPGMLEQGVLATTSPTLTSTAGPWGISIASNLTPDEETGIGRLTADALIKSWREGVHWQTGQPIKPPMPWTAYAQLSDEDIRAIHAYLMSLEPKKAPPLPAPEQ